MDIKILHLPTILNNKLEERIWSSLKNIGLIFSFSILTGICAQIKLEIGIVPITLQTVMVLLSGAWLGAKRGALSQITYIIMGLSGIPLFAQGWGMAYFLSPSFGYVLGFVFATFIVGWLCERNRNNQNKTIVIAMLLGNLVIYLFGIIWLAGFVGFERAMLVGLYPFIFTDALKIILAIFIYSLFPISRNKLSKI